MTIYDYENACIIDTEPPPKTRPPMCIKCGGSPWLPDGSPNDVCCDSYACGCCL